MLFLSVFQVYAEGNEKFKPKSGIRFTENKGQVSDQHGNPRPDVLFSGEVGGMVFHIRKDGVSYQLYKRSSSPRIDESTNTPADHGSVDSLTLQGQDSIIIHRIDINWINPNPNFTVEYGEATEGHNNYYLASCPNGALNILSYESITFKNVWDGIDVKWYENHGELEYDFILKPGANVSDIKCKIDGVMTLSLEKSFLKMETGIGNVGVEAPFAFQQDRQIGVRHVLDRNVLSFTLDDFNKGEVIIIDPIVRVWSSYYGGSNNEQFYSSAIISGSPYFVGNSSSANNIAASGAYQSTVSASFDAVIVKMSANGVRQWGTYYGGNGNDYAISVNSGPSNELFLVGGTSSTNVISSTGSHQSTFGGSLDAFLLKMNSSGQRTWATYIGGTLNDEAWHCFADGSGNVYVSGKTESSNNMVSSNAHQTSLGSSTDAFLIKFNASGQRQWGTYFGGNGEDWGRWSQVDQGGFVYLTGLTASTNNISTSGAFQSSMAGLSDAYLAKFHPNGTLIWSTYFGGTGADRFDHGVIDPYGDLFFVGVTSLSSGLATSGAHQTLFGGGIYDALICKFDSSGSRIWTSYYGGNSNDFAFKSALDRSGNYLVTGYTESTSMISTINAFQPSNGGGKDAFLAKFTPSGTRIWDTYYGGPDAEEGWGISINDSSLYLSGASSSDTLMSTPNSHQPIYGGGGKDAFVVKFQHCSANNSFISPAACDTYTSPSGRFVWTASGNYVDTLTNAEGCDSLINIELEVTSFDHTVTTHPSYLESNDSNATYQWYDCSMGKIIQGETGRTFTPGANGQYAVILNKLFCSDTSACIDVTWIGIDEHATSDIRIYPNPVKDELTVDFDRAFSSARIEIMNNLGQIIIARQTENVTQEILDVSELTKGVYTLRVTSDALTFTGKFIKE